MVGGQFNQGVFMWNEVAVGQRSIIKHLQNIGKVEAAVGVILSDDIMFTLSKHNEWWDTEKLEEVRLKLSWIKGQLEDIQGLLNPESE